jgi:hypothetical protein
VFEQTPVRDDRSDDDAALHARVGMAIAARPRSVPRPIVGLVVAADDRFLSVLTAEQHVVMVRRDDCVEVPL